MSRITKTFASKNAAMQPDSQNLEQYPAFKKADKAEYLQVLLCNTLGNTFYTDRKQQTDEATKMHALAIAQFPDFVGPAAVYARNKGFMRSQPTMAMAYLAQAQHADFERFFDQVILTPNDLIDFMTVLGTLVKGQGGRRVKRVVGRWLATKLTPYWVIKYGSESHTGYSLRDVLITIHPTGMNTELAEYIMRGKLPEKSSLPGMNQISDFEALKNAETEADAVAAALSGRLPHEVVTPFAAKYPGLWNVVGINMPIFATLRNLNTLARHGGLDVTKKRIQDMFSSAEAVGKSKILPYQFYKAFKMTEGLPAWVQDSIRDAVDLSVANIPDMFNKTVVALDRSGSMSGQLLEEGSILGISLARKSDDCIFYAWDDKLETVKVSKRDSILSQAALIHSRGGTDTSLPILQMMADAKAGRVADTLILITDGQQNRGDPFYTVIEKYRKQYNKKLKLFLIDVGNYATTSGGLVKESDLNYMIVGMAPSTLEFITLAQEGFISMADRIEKGDLQ